MFRFLIICGPGQIYAGIFAAKCHKIRGPTIPLAPFRPCRFETVEKKQLLNVAVFLLLFGSLALKEQTIYVFLFAVLSLP